MSILRGKLDGKIVYASQGEELRNKDVLCPYPGCNAKMNVRKFPRKTDEYLFALNDHEQHGPFCQEFEGSKNIPEFKGISPEEFVALLSKPAKVTAATTVSQGNSEGNERDRNVSEDFSSTIPPVRTLTAMIHSGKYYTSPFEKTDIDSNYRYIDIVIFDRWAKLIWKNNRLEEIGSRVVDARQVAGFSSNALRKHNEIAIKGFKQLWFKVFWKENGNYKSVMFCLEFDSKVVLKKACSKLFNEGMDDNNSYNEFIPKKGKADALIAANWEPLEKEECKKKCPMKMCEGCLGSYWGKCNNPKQVEFFPEDIMTKNKGAKNV